MLQRFRDRTEAGRLLAERLSGFAGRDDVVVLALPRGGVPVAFEVAERLDVPLDIFVVRKLGVPGHEELAFGAIASGGVRVVSELTMKAYGVDRELLDRVVAREQGELVRREKLYRGDTAATDVSGKTVIIVDDGLATGATMMAAVRALKMKGPKRIIVAVPVCSASTCEELDREVDVWCVCVMAPEPFYAVGLWYEDFSQTTDEEVQTLLANAEAHQKATHHYA